MPQTHAHDHGHQGEDASCCRAVETTLSAQNRLDRAASYRFIFEIQGMDCAEEVDILRREIGPLVGGEDHLDFDVLNGKMMVAAGAGAASAEAIRTAVARTGMRAEEWQIGKQAPRPADERRRRMQTGLTAASGAFVFIGLALHAWITGSLSEPFGEGLGRSIPLPVIAAYAAAIVLGGRYVAVKAGMRLDVCGRI